LDVWLIAYARLRATGNDIIEVLTIGKLGANSDSC
jgi:hypothetical protein